MHQDVVAQLVTHLQQNPAWGEAQTHEGWIAVETASYFRRELGAGVAREAPYVIVTEQQIKATKYADVYVQYQSGTKDSLRHLFFELKCVPERAASWEATLRAFVYDIERKLMRLDVPGTHALWRTGKDAWCQNLGELPSRITEGMFVGIGMLFVALHVDREKHLQELRNRMRDNRVPITPVLDLELPPADDGKTGTLCLAYRVDLPSSATRELLPTQDSREVGRQQGFRELLLQLLRQRFGEAEDTQTKQRVANASIEQIEVWAGRVLSAANLAEVFTD